MNSNSILLAIFTTGALLIFGCSDSPRITKDMLAPEPNYPEELEYRKDQNRYMGAMELELKFSEVVATDKKKVNGPIHTFEEAFNEAYALLCETYGKESIDTQLPLLIDHWEGIWIIDGAFPRSSDPNVITVGGTAHLAFEAESGKITYLWHSL